MNLHERARELRKEGATYRKISEALGISATKARALCASLGDRIHALKSKGLTLEQIAERLRLESYRMPRGGEPTLHSVWYHLNNKKILAKKRQARRR